MPRMTERPLISNTELSYVISITMPTPTIRIKIPKVLVKAIQRRNSVRSRSNTSTETDAQSNGKSKKKRSLRKKVGAIFSNVFGNKKPSSSPEEHHSNGQNGAIGGDGDDDHDHHDHGQNGAIGGDGDDDHDHHDHDDHDDHENKVKKVSVEGPVDKEVVVKSTRKGRSVRRLNGGGVVQERAVATGFGVSKPLLANQIVVAAEEGKEVGKPKPGALLKVHSKRTKGLEPTKAKGDEVERNLDEDGSLSSVFGGGERNTNGVGTRSKTVSLKQQQEKWSELTKTPSRTSTTARRRKLKLSWSMKKIMGREAEEQELCKKRILMGGKCRPLGTIQYDENGFLLPEV